MQFVGPLLAVFAMFGGLFIPISALSPGLQTAARFSPVYGVGQLARAHLHRPRVEEGEQVLFRRGEPRGDGQVLDQALLGDRAQRRELAAAKSED